MNFYFFDPGTLDLEAGRRGPGCQNLAFQRFDPMILCSFLWRIRWTTLENHRTKQMMLYEQITFFMIFFLRRGSKNRFLDQKKQNRIEPEPARTGADRNRTVGFLTFGILPIFLL